MNSGLSTYLASIAWTNYRKFMCRHIQLITNSVEKNTPYC